MSDKPGDRPAFPYPIIGESVKDCAGLSIRQWYKGMAIQGILASGKGPGIGKTTLGNICAWADALLAEDAEHEKKNS